MDVILHIGAHCTGAKTLSGYALRHDKAMAETRLGFLDVQDAFCGDLKQSEEGRSYATLRDVKLWRMRRALINAEKQGVQTFILSDRHALGDIETSVEACDLYPDVEKHLKRAAEGLEGQITRVVLAPQDLSQFWSSLIACAVQRGRGIPGQAELSRMVESRRSWREVITDIARALPDFPLEIIPFESCAGRPEQFLQRCTGRLLPREMRPNYTDGVPTLPDLRRSVNQFGGSAACLPLGMGRWNPFALDERAILSEKYRNDMFWLTSGADGLANLKGNRLLRKAGKTAPQETQKKGQPDELTKRRMESAGRRRTQRALGR